MQAVRTRDRFAGRALALLLAAATSGSALSCISAPVAQARDGLLNGALTAFSPKKVSRDEVLTSGDGTYIDRILEDRDSVLDRWPDRRDDPIRVWIEPVRDGGKDPSTFPSVVADAFNTWASLGIPVRFRFVASRSEAEVRVQWVSALIRRTGSTTWRADHDGWLQASDVTLATHVSGGDPIDARGMRAIALHEIGHVLGLSHSDNAHDIMAPLVRVTDPSPVDCATLRLLYTFPAGRVR